MQPGREVRKRKNWLAHIPCCLLTLLGELVGNMVRREYSYGNIVYMDEGVRV